MELATSLALASKTKVGHILINPDKIGDDYTIPPMQAFRVNYISDRTVVLKSLTYKHGEEITYTAEKFTSLKFQRIENIG